MPRFYAAGASSLDLVSGAEFAPGALATERETGHKRLWVERAGLRIERVYVY